MVVVAAAASLYWHVPSKDDLQELMFDAITGQIALPRPPSGDSRADLRAIARRTRAMFQRHPWAILPGIRPGLGPNTQRYAQTALASLRDLTPDPGLPVDVHALLNNYLFGFAHRETAWQQARAATGLTDTRWAVRVQHYIAQAAGPDPTATQVLSAHLHLASHQARTYGPGWLMRSCATAATRDQEGANNEAFCARPLSQGQRIS